MRKSEVLRRPGPCRLNLALAGSEHSSHRRILTIVNFRMVFDNVRFQTKG